MTNTIAAITNAVYANDLKPGQIETQKIIDSMLFIQNLDVLGKEWNEETGIIFNLAHDMIAELPRDDFRTLWVAAGNGYGKEFFQDSGRLYPTDENQEAQRLWNVFDRALQVSPAWQSRIPMGAWRGMPIPMITFSYKLANAIWMIVGSAENQARIEHAEFVVGAG